MSPLPRCPLSTQLPTVAVTLEQEAQREEANDYDGCPAIGADRVERVNRWANRNPTKGEQEHDGAQSLPID